MKKIILYLSAISIITTFLFITNESLSGRNNQGSSEVNSVTKISRLPAACPSFPLLTTYYIPVTILDPNGTCEAQYCNLTIDAYEATAYCESVSTTLVGYVQYVHGTADYVLQVSTNGSWVEVKITIHGDCHYSVNSNYCCVDLNNISTCRLYVCP